MRAALRETDRLRQEMNRVEGMLTEFRQHEGSLKTTLIAAQRLADDIKSNAELEAGRIIRDAEGRSDLLLDKTQSRLEDIQREIDGLGSSATTSRRRSSPPFRRCATRSSTCANRKRVSATTRFCSIGHASSNRPSRTANIRGAQGRGVVLIRVIPRARKTECAGVRDGALVIKVAAPPVEGAANQALIEFLSNTLHVPRRAVRILGGEHGRRKRVDIDGMTAAEVEARLSYN